MILNTKTDSKEQKPRYIKVWENLQVIVLFGTILGQVLVGAFYLVAQSIWLAVNVLALSRDFILQRPLADKIKDAGLCALTIGLVILRLFNIY